MSVLNRFPALLLPLALACGGADDPMAPADGGATAPDAGRGVAADAGVELDAGAPDSGVPPRAPIEVVGADALRDLVAADAVQVVDVRDANAFAAGHVPGAVHLPTGGLRGTVGGVPGQVVARSAAEAIFEGAGVDPARDLVVVGARNDTGTSRALWTLALFGATQVSLLDGGFPAWQAAGGETATDATATPTSWTEAPTDEDLRVDQAWLLEHYDDPDVRVFDVRTPGEYAAGHVPGAINANWMDNLGAGGLFNDAETIRAFHGDPAEPTLVVYCQSGARASVSWALLKAVGYETVRLYDGSWNEWGADPTTPKETD